MSIYQIIWIVALVMSIIAEAATVQLVAVWFMPGALAALVVSLFADNIIIEAIAFLVVTVSCLTFLRKPIKKLIMNKPFVPTNTGRYIGQTAIVTEEINNIEAKGAVRIFGETWSARSESGESIAVGEKVSVVCIEGVKLICKTIQE